MSSTGPTRKPYRKAPPQHREVRPEPREEEPSQEPATEAERIHFLQHQNDDLRRRLAYATTKMEAMEHEVEAGRHYLEAELSRSREELEKLKDKFRRLQNSYTTSQRTNQDLEEKLHALIKKAELERKTLDWEIVELTNKLLDAKTAINRLEELNERYRQDCNLAVQLLKCNKSHFRNHKFADLPYKLQDMVSKHLQSSSPGADTPPAGVCPSEVVPTAVIARVLEKPESLILNSATSGSGSGPSAQDFFVHVDMSGPGGQNGVLRQQGSQDGEEPPACEKLSPYPAPPPPHPLYPGRRVIEFSDEKVQIPKNSPLPNCTYATRQAISLSLVQEEGLRSAPASPASSASYPPRARSADRPARSPPSSASSEEDMLANWQRMFVERAAPSVDLSQRTSFSRDTALRFSRSMQELSHAAQPFTQPDWPGHSPRRGPGGYGGRYSQEEAQDLLLATPPEEEPGDHACRSPEEEEPEDHACRSPEEEEPEDHTHRYPAEEEPEDHAHHSPEEPQDHAHGFPEDEEEPEDHAQCTAEEEEEPQDHAHRPPAEEKAETFREKPPSGRPHRSPKRMGVHHLHRKDSLTRAQEHGNLLN